MSSSWIAFTLANAQQNELCSRDSQEFRRALDAKVLVLVSFFRADKRRKKKRDFYAQALGVWGKTKTEYKRKIRGDIIFEVFPASKEEKQAFKKIIQVINYV